MLKVRSWQIVAAAYMVMTFAASVLAAYSAGALSALQSDCQHEVSGQQMNWVLGQYGLYALVGIAILMIALFLGEADRLSERLVCSIIVMCFVWIALVSVLAGLTVAAHRPDGIAAFLAPIALFAPMLMLWRDARNDMRGNEEEQREAKRSFQNIVMISLAIMSVAISIVFQEQSMAG